ncbi:MAG: hypothetical protein A3B91_01895 [Candidatus Yanofskybacteria bacterium RIFCSPHIGHO2_02_FULL_41_29]|uniref:Uncharacterized protein n=1 Tax=Candidatus Yanofskybacteria bacterium RIFCSPHIGHO2_01_FULL_41_53 TaxID=1802663 RepID=A0A1F8EH37_9BACT|nr:MAG: hypothetical protein A2650_04335 [Candidatus Yanofskybacteria bacterium RIFCSPHIGHO2_01_FULL_41_53]OGN11213.1 MAG: hypothetical protein A3B91_01895 [Candidatus Yanofskybacteria bacterium RIFCSPHIGHO2_02_FULL_41_29]OGN16960.1 MAG: hypothetical protein A3F48_00890 [Candidatus Yanofskybacteria bacterium RIFCSPHIGHO2_12_FULL_41_9]OGN22279.1 MAG: hypothetical protein A2916_04140 [Candidatus Yanofskybacteria bacterium RIFCSPLOWO2_01_FULL_41_67]OGN29647.1 MAG: hypothetical protein A3H54_00780 
MNSVRSNPFWTITALIGFILISVFGLFLMPYDGSHHDTSCLASLINNLESPCPSGDPLGFANFHNDAVSKILNLIPTDAVSIAYLASLIMLIFGLFYFRPFQDLLLSPLASISESISVSYPPQTDQRSWFSLHENSPSFF